MPVALVQVIGGSGEVVKSIQVPDKRYKFKELGGILDQTALSKKETGLLDDTTFRVGYNSTEQTVVVRDNKGVEWRVVEPGNPVTTPLIPIGTKLLGIHIRDTDSAFSIPLFKCDKDKYYLRISAVEPEEMMSVTR
jgi:hypothetical protein